MLLRVGHGHRTGHVRPDPATNSQKSKQKGRKSEVDYTLSGYGERESEEQEEDPLYVVPVEAKRELKLKDAAQLTQCMSTVCNGRYIQGTVGMLLDQEYVRFAFSTLSFDSVPLPIVFISPALAWRQELAFKCSVGLAMSLLTHFHHKRYAVGSEWANYLGEETWATVNNVAKLQKEQLANPRKCPNPDRHTSLSERIRKYEEAVIRIRKYEEAVSSIRRPRAGGQTAAGRGPRAGGPQPEEKISQE